MDLENSALQRLHSQALMGSTFNSPEEVVDWMAAVQAQDYPGAKWSLGLRQPHGTEAEVEKSIGGKAVVRSWVMRGTLHFVTARDILWLLNLLGPKIVTGNQRRYRQLELDEKTLHRSNDVLAKALQKEKSLTRKELLELLRQAGISTEGQRGIYMLQRASLDRLICQGTVTANNAAFMSLDGFPSRKLSRDEALAELAGRYFASRGPATLPDFIWWSGLPAADARTALESIRSTLLKETIDKQMYWWSEARPTRKRKAEAAFLLPGFDEFLIAYKDRRVSLGAIRFSQLSAGGGILPGTLILDGKVRGTWKRTFKKDRVEISLQPFEPLTTAEEARVAAAAREFGRFLRRSARLI